MITFAKVGGPPDNWQGIRVFDDRDNEVRDVIEVDTEKGYIIKYKRDSVNNLIRDGEDAAIQRIEGKFRIEVPDASK